MLSTYKVRRLAEMDFPEIRHRLGHALRITQERIRLARRGDKQEIADWRRHWNSSAVRSSGFRVMLCKDRDTAEAALPAYLFSRTKPLFYRGVVRQTEIAAIYRASLPEGYEQILSDASRTCEHQMKIFAYPEVSCGPSIPWRKDIVHKIESGLDHRSQIHYLDFQTVGDSKIVWEPNRHQHLVRLAMAYRLTGDDRFAEECFSQWEDWQLHNPHLCGINWTSSLELAIRSWSWIWMAFLLAGSVAATGRRLAELTRALALHADFIIANLSIYFSPNTHLLGEGFALFVIGLLFPELRSAPMYWETGRRILIEEMTNQVRADGFHAEQSTCYHRYATDFFLCAAILADQNGCPFPDAYRKKLELMAEALLHSAWPDGTHPMIGDADGGRLLPMSSCDPNDHRGTLSIAAVYFGRQDFRTRAGNLYHEILWLFGPDAATRFQELIPKQPQVKSKAFSESGIVAMRSDWGPGAHMLLFDTGPQGMGNCGHGHADALSVICSSHGTNWLIDPGTFVYTASPKYREFFRSTHAHNTLVVDDQGQSEPQDTFRWRRVCPARMELWATFPSLDYAIGSHEGYTRPFSPLCHRRHVVFVKPHYWFLMDEVNGEGTHSLQFLFHLPPRAKLQTDKNRCLAAVGANRFLITSDPCIHFETILGSEQPIQGWFSQDYGHREPAPVLVGKTHCTAPRRFPWLLWPAVPDALHLRQVADEPSTWALETNTQMEYLAFGGERKRSHELATDAKFAFFRQNRKGQAGQITLLAGALLEWHGQCIYESEQKAAEISIDRNGDSLQVLMRPEAPFAVTMEGVTSVSLNGRRVGFRRTRSGIEVQERN